MKIVEIDDLEDRITLLLESGEAVLLIRGADPVGYFVPIATDLEKLPRELGLRLARELAEQTREKLEAQGITEEQALVDFEAWGERGRRLMEEGNGRR